MGLKLVLHQRAIDDLGTIHDYLVSEASPASAELVRSHLRRRMRRLLDTPLMGPRTSHPEIRILPPSRFSYRIYYTVTHEAVVVLHVLHTARHDPDLNELV
mgnify:CR=1 FL=1